MSRPTVSNYWWPMLVVVLAAVRPDLLPGLLVGVVLLLIPGLLYLHFFDGGIFRS